MPYLRLNSIHTHALGYICAHIIEPIKKKLLDLCEEWGCESIILSDPTQENRLRVCIMFILVWAGRECTRPVSIYEVSFFRILSWAAVKNKLTYGDAVCVCVICQFVVRAVDALFFCLFPLHGCAQCGWLCACIKCTLWMKLKLFQSKFRAHYRNSSNWQKKILVNCATLC